MWYATDDEAENVAMIGLREARKKVQHATTSRMFYKKGENGRERVTSNRSKSIQELKKVTTCDRCGSLGHWEGECPLKRDTAGDRHRVIDPAEVEGSENNRAQETADRKARAKAEVGVSS